MVPFFGQWCSHQNCTVRATYDRNDGKRVREFCTRHALEGMVDVAHERCAHQSCTVVPTFGIEGGSTSTLPRYCVKHAKGGMASLGKKCEHGGCRINSADVRRGGHQEGQVLPGALSARHGLPQSKALRASRVGAPRLRRSVLRGPNGQSCAPGTPTRGWSTSSRARCMHQGCAKQPNHGAPDSKKAEFCSWHAPEGATNVRSKRCLEPGCTLHPSHGAPDGTRDFCAGHALQGRGMVGLANGRPSAEDLAPRPHARRGVRREKRGAPPPSPRSVGGELAAAGSSSAGERTNSVVGGPRTESSRGGRREDGGDPRQRRGGSPPPPPPPASLSPPPAAVASGMVAASAAGDGAGARARSKKRGRRSTSVHPGMPSAVKAEVTETPSLAGGAISGDKAKLFSRRPRVAMPPETGVAARWRDPTAVSTTVVIKEDVAMKAEVGRWRRLPRVRRW